MKFPGAWIHSSHDTVAVTFTTFDDTDLSPDSQWTEAWQNEGSQAPIGLVDPALILAETGRRLLEMKPDLAERVQAFAQDAGTMKEGTWTTHPLEIRDAERFGLLCLSLVAQIAAVARKHKLRAAPGTDHRTDDEIPY